MKEEFKTKDFRPESLAGRGETCQWCGDTSPGKRCRNCGADKLPPPRPVPPPPNMALEGVETGGAVFAGFIRRSMIRRGGER